jgi:hypothetical protein
VIELSQKELRRSKAIENAVAGQRGPKVTLLGFQDDATGQVLAARFQLEPEDTVGYLVLPRQVVERHGVPLSLYRDRHSTFQRNDAHCSLGEELEGRQHPTQLGRVLEELGIEQIAALTPQAKGWIERLWRTFQDRLRSELRLAGSRELEQANEVPDGFLPGYNRLFAQPVREAGNDFRRPLSRKLNWDGGSACDTRGWWGKTTCELPLADDSIAPDDGKQGYAGARVWSCRISSTASCTCGWGSGCCGWNCRWIMCPVGRPIGRRRG